MILLNKPYTPDIKKYTALIERVNSNAWYTNFGPLHNELTEKLEEYLGVKNLLLVNNGTLALQVAYKTLGIEKAITTPFSFVATSSTLAWERIESQFLDIDKDNLNIDVEKMQIMLAGRNDKNLGIVATHVFGNPCDVKSLDKLTSQKVIFDAAHAFGVNVNGNSVLNYGDASTLSFHATKIFHTIEGGAIVFKHRKNYEKAKEMINFGIKLYSDIQSVGINAKMNEYQAAAGLVVLDDISNIIERRVSLYQAYVKGLKDHIQLQSWNKEATENGAYFPIIAKSINERNKIELALSENNIQFRRYFSPSLDTLNFPGFSGYCETSRDIADRILCLPLHNYLTPSDVGYVNEVVKRSV